MPPHLHRRLTIETALTVPPVRVMQASREYLVCPCVMVVEGVLNEGLVSGEAIRACHWDGIPVVLNHPLDAAGDAVSAQDPAVLAMYGLGYVYRTQCRAFQQGTHTLTRAHAELWLDVAQVDALGSDAAQVLQQLESQTPLEVSTAFFCDTERTPGTFYGVPYVEVHRNLQADHLALLPQSIGACSWAAGCGAPRLNHQAACGAGCACDTCTERSVMEPPSPTTWQTFVSAMQKLFAHGQLSADPKPEPTPPVPTPEPTPAPDPKPDPVLTTNRTDNDVRQALYGALAREMGTDYTPIFIDSIDTATQSFTYSQGERLVMRSWEMVGDVLSLSDDAQDVQRDTRYVPVTTNQQKEAPPMTTPQSSPVAIKARVNALIANTQSGWTDRDRPMLEGMSEAALIRLEAQPVTVPAMVAEIPKAPETLEEAIATLDPKLQKPILAMAKEYEGRKQAAIAALIANKSCLFTQEKLQAFEVEELESLVAMAQGVAYTGKGLPAARRAPAEQDAPPPAPDTMARVLERQKEMGLR